ncbi:MAG: hypothetical protein AMXMBFR44_6320 [Candidatus Campbellbacteria bacterium]
MNLPNLKNIVGKGFNLDDRFIENYDVLAQVVELLKKFGNRIVLTQGVYDMYHVGHGRYLRQAKSFGDVLVVGVDTDELTRSRKGPKRPFDTFKERVEVLADNRAVNIITPRELNDDPNRLIEVVRPDILIVSKTTSDFSEEKLAECRALCGEIKLLEAQAATSTTAKLRRIMADGVQEFAKKIHTLTESFLEELEGAVQVKDDLEKEEPK